MNRLLGILNFILITSEAGKLRKPFALQLEAPIASRIITSGKEEGESEQNPIDLAAFPDDEMIDLSFSPTIENHHQLPYAQPQVDPDYFLTIVKEMVKSELQNAKNITCIKVIPDKIDSTSLKVHHRTRNNGRWSDVLPDDVHAFTSSTNDDKTMNETMPTHREEQKFWPTATLQQILSKYPLTADSSEKQNRRGSPNVHALTQSPVISEGSYGGYSWTIEKAPSAQEIEAIIPAEAIYDAITQTEKDESLQAAASDQNFHKRLNPPHSATSRNSYSTARHEAHVHHHYNAKPASSYSSSQNVAQASIHYKGADSYDQTDSQPNHGWHEDPENQQDPHPHSHRHHHLQQWLLTKAKKLLNSIHGGGGQGSGGGGNHDPSSGHGGGGGNHGHGASKHRHTSTLLDLTILALAILAFMGYIGALTFQTLLPSLMFPLVPGLVNVSTTNPGLFGLMFGRMENEEPNILFLDEDEMTELDLKVKRALDKVGSANISQYE